MTPSVIVIGAGWTGLAAAYTLVKQGLPVTLLEAAPQAGGRARSIAFQQTVVDNGQHLFLGAYHHCLSILQELKVPEQAVFHRSPLWLKLHAPASMELKLNQLAPPLNLILGILTAKGLRAYERKAALRFCREVKALQFKLSQDISVETLLFNLRQPTSLVAQLWAPLTLAALSTPVQQASAQVFLNVLKQSFTQNNKNSDFLFPKTHLSDLFVNPILDFLKKKSIPILFNQRVQELLIEKDHCLGVKTNKQIYQGNYIILATSAMQARALLNAPALIPLKRTIACFQAQPITTVYLRFDRPINWPAPMVGFIQPPGQWVFDRGMVGQNNLLSVVITGQGEHTDWSHEQLVQALVSQIKQVYPSVKAPIHSKVICEKSAAFLCDVNIDTRRPIQQTPIKGLLLAGDYTQAGYPASLEGAVKSGISAAELVLTKQPDATYSHLA